MMFKLTFSTFLTIWWILFLIINVQLLRAGRNNVLCRGRHCSVCPPVKDTRGPPGKPGKHGLQNSIGPRARKELPEEIERIEAKESKVQERKKGGCGFTGEPGVVGRDGFPVW
ncbi:collagen alpha-4(IV) chain-like [Cyprinodon tularosa]|uniref:collagen alpha-4(IV) chain-like n=1 Tax=Cyprinodon tularosa TaxID=77115 RepID=UPI0018E2150D|nr:collagen alpha-4(IV) chain-like [Cyprinodon tularosa]